MNQGGLDSDGANNPMLRRRSTPPALRQRRSTPPGLRLQILVALAGVILVAYVPLFFAIAQVTRATSLAYRDDAARALGRAVATHVTDVARNEPEMLPAALAGHVGEGGPIAIAVYDHGGATIATSGSPEELALLHAPSRPYGESAARVASRSGRALDVILPSRDGAIVVRVPTDDDGGRASQLVRGVALYMSVFALGLLVFAYIVLTRSIVRPIERLARAADRVATGARDLDLPHGGGREVTELGSSVRAMAARLLAEEEALRNKVAELTKTTQRLSETREQLEGSERMASVGRLAAGVAHEIGNPIAAIMGMHDLLDDIEIPEGERADFLRRMRKETERIHVVVRDLLDYARPEAGPTSSSFVLASANLAEIVADTMSLVRPQKEWRGVEASVDIAPNLHVALSPQRLTQVFLNLLLNAGAALADMEPEEARTVAVRARPEGDHVRIEIEDNGPGVSPELRERIFDPFVTTKDVGAGTGLGLAVCRGIIEGAKGKIGIDASYTQGARFVIELPHG